MNDSMSQYTLFTQQHLIDEALVALNGDKKPCCIMLKGASGTGKSFVATQISKQWSKTNAENQIVHIQCESVLMNTHYHPLINAVSPLKLHGSPHPFVTKSIGELARGIPVAGDLVSFLIETLSNFNSQEKQKEIRYLGSVEQLLIHDLSNIVRNGNLLIILDDIQWIDEKSLEFIELISKEPFLTTFPLFRLIKFIFIQNTDQEFRYQETYESLTRRLSVAEFNLTLIPKHRYIDSLRRFGFTGELKEDTLHFLYSCTGGHLALIKKLSEYLSSSQQNPNAVIDIESFNQEEDSKRIFIEKLLLYKLSELGATGKQISEILEFASVIGMSFSYEELLCISKEREEVLKEIIAKAREIQLITEQTSTNVFSHEIIREFFANRLENKKFSHYVSFASCLAKLKPSDYATRATYLFESGQPELASEIYILEVLKNERESIEPSPLILQRISKFAQSREVLSFLDSMRLAYAYFHKGKYLEAKSILAGTEDLLPEKLVAEKYYLLSLCYLKTMDKEDLMTAKQFLSNWDQLELSESEIWLRLTATLMTVSANIDDIDGAKFVERKLMLHLAGRKKYDASSDYYLNILRRKSNALHINEIACNRTEKSIEYFSGESKSSIVFPVQYYYSLCNHSANLLARGDFLEAFTFSKGCLNLIKEYPYVRFIEPQIPSSNYIVSGFLSNLIPSTDAVNLFEQIQVYEDGIADSILIKNNHYVVAIHNNLLDDAYRGFKQLHQLTKAPSFDMYYKYFVESNLTLLEYVMGNVEFAKTSWKALYTSIPNIPDKIFLQRRHEIIDSALKEVATGDWRVFDKYISEKFPTELGKSWKFYGRGFMFSDIQLWYES